MKVSEFLNKLVLKLGEGDLNFVATELKSYFKTIQKDNFWIEKSEEVLESLKDVETNPEYTQLTKDLRIDKVKNKLSSIILNVKENTNTNNELKKTNTNFASEEFKSLIDLQKGTISIESKGSKGIISQSGKILLLILTLLLMFFFAYYLLKNKPLKKEITNCDCSKLEILRANANDGISKNKIILDNLVNKIDSLEAKGLNKDRIQQKEHLLETRRMILSKSDSINSLVLPEIESIAKKCPFQDCNNSIDNI